MKFRRRKRHHGSVEVNSLSDILFFLLLFFLMISTMGSSGIIKLMLPKTTINEKVESKIINLSITKDLQYYIENRHVAYNDLPIKIKKMATNRNNVKVKIRADQSISVQDLLKIVDVLNTLKIPTVVATEKI